MHLLRLARKPVRLDVEHLPDGAIVRVMRGVRMTEQLRMGPNEVAFHVIHRDGSIDLSRTTNLLTNAGRDLALTIGAARKDGALTASSATSATPSGGGLTTDQYKGWRVFCPVTGLTTAPVYGNIGSNSTTVLTIDAWWVGTSDTATGTTPASTNGYMIVPTFDPRFIGLTADTGAASASDTALASELTTNGLARVKATYAHSGGTGSQTLSGTWNVSGGTTTVHKGGLLTASTSTAAGVLAFETVANADAIVTTSDTLNGTWTVNLSG